MRFAPAIFANSVFLFTVIGYGSILRPLFPGRLSRVDRIALTLLGGIGLLGTVLFLIGQIRLSRTIIILTLFPSFWGAVLVLRALRTSFRDVRCFRPPLVPAIVVAAVLLVIGFSGLAAPTGDISTPGLKNDSIAYHFLGPRVWLRNEVIRPVPDECLTAMPALVETDYCALISLGGSRSPGLFAVIQLGILLPTFGWPSSPPRSHIARDLVGRGADSEHASSGVSGHLRLRGCNLFRACFGRSASGAGAGLPAQMGSLRHPCWLRNGYKIHGHRRVYFAGAMRLRGISSRIEIAVLGSIEASRIGFRCGGWRRCTLVHKELDFTWLADLPGSVVVPEILSRSVSE